MSAEDQPIRAFFAIELADQTKVLIANLILKLQKNYPEDTVRWVKPQNLHITLQFLKQISRSDLSQLIALAEDAIGKLSTVKLSLGPVQFFPTVSHPNAIVLDTQPQQELMKLSQTIGACMRKLNLLVENRLFRGHATLGHFMINTAKENFIPPSITPLDIPPEEPRAIILFQSNTSTKESHYLPIKYLPFKS